MRECLHRSLIATALVAAATYASAEEPADAVNSIADRWLKQIELRSPVTWLGGGLTLSRNDSLDQNAPEQLASWREFLARIEKELAAIPQDRLIGRPEWVTAQYLRQGLAQNEAARLCRSELWQVSVFGWTTHLMHLANLQPVGTDELRQQALTRWRGVPAWIDQEIANLREGLRLGHTAADGSVRALLTQLDALLAAGATESSFMSPATRDGSDGFRAEWTAIIEKQVWPALERYRDFLRDEYLRRTRTSPSLSTNTNGAGCYRALLHANTTVDEDPRALFRAGERRLEAERRLALELGRKIYGEKVRGWESVAAAASNDPRYRFANSGEVAAYVQAAHARAAAAIDRMITDPPSPQVDIKAFPPYMQATGPAGEYIPGAEDGSRRPLFYFRDDPARQQRGPLEGIVFHEALPGHHLQAAVLAQNRRNTLHPITRVLWFSGPGEGWATYAETLAHELGLYTSDYEVICWLLHSTTPNMVADIGMHAMGWSKERTIAFLQQARPHEPEERAERMVATIAGAPGAGAAYTMGAMQFEQMRALARERLGARFDVREFHRVMLEDGRLPFAALRSKLQRWIER